MFRTLGITTLTVVFWTCGNTPLSPAADTGTAGDVAAASPSVDLDAGAGAPATGGGPGLTGGGTGATGGGSSATGGGSANPVPMADAGSADAGVLDAGGTTLTPPPDAGSGQVSPPDAGPVVRFVAIGDTGKSNAGQHQVGAAMGTLCAAQGCDFVVLLGDNFYPSGVSSTTDPLWQTAFVDPYATVNAPFYAVLGNHDYGGDGAGTDLPRGDNEVAYSLVNPKWRMPAHHFKWRLQHVEFFAGDTNRSMFSVDQDARRDFDTWLPASTAQWKIVFAHHPYKSNGEHGNAGNYDGLSFIPVANGAGVKRFVEERVCGRADFYITGHDHNIQLLQDTCTRPGSNLHTQLMLSGGAAATTPLKGSNPTWYQTADLGFVYVVITGNVMTSTVYDANGVAQFTRTFTK